MLELQFTINLLSRQVINLTEFIAQAAVQQSNIFFFFYLLFAAAEQDKSTLVPVCLTNNPISAVF